MDHKEILGKAVIDASDLKPKDFSEKLGTVLQDKLKTKLSDAVKREEQRIFKKHKYK